MNTQRAIVGRFLVASTILALGLEPSSPCRAADVTFTGPGLLTWDSTANWVGGSLPTASDVAVFTQTAGATEPTINAAYTVQGLRFTNPDSTLIRGASRQLLTIGSEGITVNAGSGAATIGSNLAQANRIGVILAANHAWTNNSTSVLRKEQGAMASPAPGTNLQAFTLTYQGSGPIEHAASIGGTGGLVRAGSGTTTIFGTNTFSGGVTINSGTIVLADNSALGTGTLTMNGGALGATSTRTPVNAMTWAGDFSYQGPGTFSASGPVTMSGGSRSVTVNAGTFNVAGAIGDGGGVLGITKAGPGLLVLGGANTYTGPTNVTAGTLAIAGNQSAATGLVTINSGAALAGTGTTGGGVTFDSGSFIGFGQTTLTVGGTISFGGSFGIANLAGLSSATPDGTYSLLTGTIDTTNLQNIGAGNLFDLGDGKQAFFTTGSGLAVSVVPEPAVSLAVAAGLAAAAGFWLRRRPGSV